MELTPTICTEAARISLHHKLPMPDSIIYATAQSLYATVWTQDADFKDLPAVKFLPKVQPCTPLTVGQHLQEIMRLSR